MAEKQQSYIDKRTEPITIAWPMTMEEDTPEQPRQPRNLQGLLRFAVDATNQENAPSGSDYNFNAMDPESRSFLEEAMSALTFDVGAEVRDVISMLSNAKAMAIVPDTDEPHLVNEVFDRLLSVIGNIDVANDFARMGGFDIFPVCYASMNKDVRVLTSKVLGEVCQNNPFCQARAMDWGMINMLLPLLQTEDSPALGNHVFALSAMCRDYDPACRELIRLGGCELMVGMLTEEEPQPRIKAARLLQHLYQNYADAREKIIDMNVVKVAANQIKKGHDSSTEHLLGLILTLLEKRDPTIVQQCNDPEINLKKIVEDTLKHPDIVRRDREDIEIFEVLLEVLKSCPQLESMNLEVDR